MGKLSLAIAALVVCSLVVSVNAATISTEVTLPLHKTNWSSTLNVPEFDASLGTLTGIAFQLSYTVDRTVKMENMDDDPSVLSTQLTVNVMLQRPDASSILSGSSIFTTSDTLPGYDGTMDFGGTSGKVFEDEQVKQITGSSSTPADLALFTGSASDALPISFSALSQANGDGNVITQFVTRTSADLLVTYTYTVPEPATMAMLAAGMLALIRRRK